MNLLVVSYSLILAILTTNCKPIANDTPKPSTKRRSEASGASASRNTELNQSQAIPSSTASGGADSSGYTDDEGGEHNTGGGSAGTGSDTSSDSDSASPPNPPSPANILFSHRSDQEKFTISTDLSEEGCFTWTVADFELLTTKVSNHYKKQETAGSPPLCMTFKEEYQLHYYDIVFKSPEDIPEDEIFWLRELDIYEAYDPNAGDPKLFGPLSINSIQFGLWQEQGSSAPKKYAKFLPGDVKLLYPSGACRVVDCRIIVDNCMDEYAVTHNYCESLRSILAAQQ